MGTDGEMLPLNTKMLGGEAALCKEFGGCFIAGDTRVNEQMSLASFHTLFLREHNRIARSLQKLNRHWDNDKVYLETRRILAAVMQKITYKDFLPKILGPKGLKPYTGYKPAVNSGISNAFATAAFRFGHSLIRPAFDILDNKFDPIGDPIDLRYMFFNNTFIQEKGITPLLLGLAGNSSEKVDRIIAPGIVKHLFERGNEMGSNLAALNIQRSRDHGLPGYNAYREFFNIGRATNFEETMNEITKSENRNILSKLYDDNPSNLEVWVAGLAESPLVGASVGRIFSGIISEQFERTRDGDRFYFERKGVFRLDRRTQIYRASLSRMYCDNLKNVVSIQLDAFLAPTDRSPRYERGNIPGIDLCKWRETKYSTKPCIYGKLETKQGICKCSCSAELRSFGPKCDAWPARRPVPWHASILNWIGQVVCSGARIGRHYVLTTTACAKHGLYVRFGIRKGLFPRLIFARIKKGPLTLLRISTLPWRQSNGIIKIGPRISETETTFVTVSGAASCLNVVRVRVYPAKKTLCQEVLSPFITGENACTLPAMLPETGRRQGGPLVQYNGRRPFLKALLTDINGDVDLPGDSFGKYITVTRPAVKQWLKTFIPGIDFNVNV